MAEAAEWAGRMGLEWARRVEALDRQLAPAGEAGLAALEPAPSERILDLGCGGGATTAAIAAAVGPGGGVTAADISPDLIAVARARPGVGHVRFLVGDAGATDLGAGHDALFSRFGCMFFDDAPAAFAHIRRALKPGARAVLVVWNGPGENPWGRIPAEVAARILGPAEPKPPTAPGPFAWADPDHPHAILTAAGFSAIEQESAAIELVIGEGDDPDPLVRGLTLLRHVGPVARRLKEAGPAAAGRVMDALADAVAPYVSDGWLRMPGSIRVIRARS